MGVKVAGDCPKCHHRVETEAPAGRATWRGECPRRGCTGKILARRIRGELAGEQGAAGAGDQPAAAAPAKKSTVVKVSGYDQRTPAPGTAGPAGVPAAADPAGRSPTARSRQSPAGDAGGQRTGRRAGRPGRRPAAAPAAESGSTGRAAYAEIFGWE